LTDPAAGPYHADKVTTLRRPGAFIAPLILIASGSLLAACGGGSSPTSPSTPSTPSSSVGACGAIAGLQTSGLAILNGSACQPARSPVVLLTLRDASGNAVGSCSGTAIAARAILTAAHCLSGSTAGVSVSFGTTDVFFATSFQVSPGYRGSSDPSSVDVGVVLLGADLPQTPVPVLATRDARVAEQAVIAGWGQDQNGASRVLKAGTTTISAVTSLALQTTYTGTGTGAGVCYGDSGGPILVSEGGVWAIAGVTSSFSGNSCSSGTNSFMNLRNPDISSFVFGLVPGAARK
jgi:secreted trypsin-like serine protease